VTKSRTILRLPPLTLIISPLETLMKEYQSDAVLMDKLNIVQRNAVRLLNLVNQLLDFRKIDVNGYYLSLSDDDIISYIHTICDSFISLSEQKDVSLTFYSAVSSLNMLFDGDKMREVMMSLLSNAFKFTCSGGRVDVFVSLVEGQDSREMLEIRVADTGIGIKKEDRERIFGHFYQVDYPDMSFSGGGGSLSIVRDFVTLHDGTVNVMDNTPVGCVFIIHIPVKRSGGKPMKIEQVQVVDKSVEDISTLQVPESYVASNVGEESKEELNHIITIEGLEEDIRRLESGNTEEIAEEKNIETISAVAPQRATVIQLVEGESNEMITHIIPPEGVPEMVTAVPEEKSELELKTVWNHAYIDLKPSGTAITSMDEKLINHAVKYVEDNIARSDLSVEELSKELGMSRVHLYKKLLAITGKTPIEFIRIIRLKRAAQLLRGSQQNISEIAYQVGFNNPKYFSRYFKEEFGILPSAFQYKQGR
jgi:AraC-like DNA-binding protein